MSKTTLQDQEIVEVKKTRTALDIIPRWIEVIHKVPSGSSKYSFRVKGKALDITKCNRCVVGEAYGFKSDYIDGGETPCKTCYNKAITFTSILDKTPEQRERAVDAFITHFNLKH